MGDGCCCCACTPAYTPFAQVCMTVPPPILAPTRPEPVEPLQLPCPCPPGQKIAKVDVSDPSRQRVDNYYNNYNIDWHADSEACREWKLRCCPTTRNCPRKECEDYTINPNQECEQPGCPTGFKPCTMKLTPPPCCDPCGVWCAQVQKCKKKPKLKKDNYYEPGPCCRPCCKHWKPKEGPCLYDDPCKAACFNHPPGIKPSGRFPPWP